MWKFDCYTQSILGMCTFPKQYFCYFLFMTTIAVPWRLICIRLWNLSNPLLPPANEVWGKVIFSVACVKNSVHREVCLSACWDTTPPEQTLPRRRHPPPEQTPPGPSTPPPSSVQCMLGDTVNKQAVYILLECNPFLPYLLTDLFLTEVDLNYRCYRTG